MKYYVKSPISGWREVTKERFDEFIASKTRVVAE